MEDSVPPELNITANELRFDYAIGILSYEELVDMMIWFCGHFEPEPWRENSLWQQNNPIDPLTNL